MSASQYGGFWKRVVAYIIDGFVLLIPTLVVSYFLMPSTEAIAENPEAAMAAMPAYYGLTLLIDLIYFAGMESSAKQATLGKMALGMKVTDVNGNRISIGRAVGRFFGKLLSGLILGIGFLMVAFTGKKQGLHDMIAGTLVQNR